MPESILDSTSFSVLDPSDQDALRDLFEKIYQGDESCKTLASNLLPLPKELSSQRKLLTVNLDFYGSKLDQNTDIFEFMSPVQKKVLEQELLFAFYIFSAQYRLDAIEDRNQALQARSEQIKKCAYLINELRSAEKKKTPKELLNRLVDDSEKHAKYLGLTIVAPLVIEMMLAIVDGKAEDLLRSGKMPSVQQWQNTGQTGDIKNVMGLVNERRLYWVWANAMLGSVFAMLPNDFANNPQARKVVGSVSPVTGYMSWILYYTRFGINLSLLLKHTIAGPWMSEEEKQISSWERFTTQLDQRKFSLLNDSIWATANMACFLWLIGNGMLGYLGNVATVALLLMDVGLTAWRFCEEDTQHNKNMARYEVAIDRLLDQLNEKVAGTDEWQQLDLQLQHLLDAEKRCKVDWTYKRYGLMNDLAYALSLMIAFSVMCCFFFPPALIAPATAMILGLAGAAMCFVLNTIYAAMNSYIEIDKSRTNRESAIVEYNVCLQRFKDTDDEPLKKQLYLDMKQLMATSAYQEQLIHHQKLKLVHALFMDIMMPPLIFVSLMFMPLGIGLAVLAAGLALAVISHYILKEYAPEADKLPALNNQEYLKFVNLGKDATIDDIQIDKKSLSLENSSFFSKGECAGSNESFDNSPEPAK